MDLAAIADFDKPFDKGRIVDECDFENDLTDRRILYELTGAKLDPGDFADDTTDEEDSGEPENSARNGGRADDNRAESLLRNGWDSTQIN